MKHDGFRLMVRRDGGRTRLFDPDAADALHERRKRGGHRSGQIYAGDPTAISLLCGIDADPAVILAP